MTTRKQRKSGRIETQPRVVSHSREMPVRHANLQAEIFFNECGPGVGGRMPADATKAKQINILFPEAPATSLSSAAALTTR